MIGKMIGKKAEKMAIGKFVSFVLVVLVIIIVIISVMGFGLIDKIKDWIPGFGDNPDDDFDLPADIVLEFDNPDGVVYRIYGRESLNVYYRCYDPGVWYWAGEDKKFHVLYDSDSLDASNFGLRDTIFTSKKAIENAIEKNKRFILDLTELDCEEGLEKIVERVLANDEGNVRRDVALDVYVNGDPIRYTDERVFTDIRVLIKKINNRVNG